MTRARDVANLIGSGNFSSTTFTATAGQTAFTISHTQGFIQVFMNGLLLDETVDYTSNGSAVTLTSGAAAGDEIEVVAYNTFSVGDALNQAAADTRYVNATGDTMTGSLTGTSAGFTGDVNIGNNDASNPVSKLRLGATLYGAADIVPVSTGHKIGLDFKTDSTGDTTIDPVTRMSISNEGYITTPFQPAFRAWKDTNSWSLSADDTFIFDSTIYNTGSHYNTSTGRFTAPVAGVYHFDFHSIQLGSSNNAHIKIYVNNTRIKGGDVHFSPNSGNYWDYVSLSTDLYLQASDYVHVITKVAMTYHGNWWSSFTGHLVG